MLNSLKIFRSGVVHKIIEDEENIRKSFGKLLQVRLSSRGPPPPDDADEHAKTAAECAQCPPARCPPAPASSRELSRGRRAALGAAPRASQYDPYRISAPEVCVPPQPLKTAKPVAACPCRRAGPCAPRQQVCVPPPPPHPPKPPFPYSFFLPFPIFLALCGLIYRFYMQRVEEEAACDILPKWRPRPFVQQPTFAEQFPKKAKYLIIGGGTAGVAAFGAIKEHDPQYKVLFFNAEDCLPYERAALSKNMWFNDKPPDLKDLIYKVQGIKHSMYYLKPEDWTPVERFESACAPCVACACGWKVVRVDADERTAYFNNGGFEQPIKYQKCLIATGARPKQLDVFRHATREVRDRVCRLRTIRDLEHAWGALQQPLPPPEPLDAESAPPKLSCVIVGAGPLATELSWTLGHLFNKMEREDEAMPVQVFHLLRDKGVLRRVVPDYLAEWLVEKLKEQGVNIITNNIIYDAYVDPESGKLNLHLSSGKVLETDYVFLCAGIQPNILLAEPSLLETDKERGGFLVNTELMARSDLYVAGDAASVYRQRAERRARAEHLLDAVSAGCTSGTNMAGHSAPYNIPSHFYVRLGEHGEVFQMEGIGEVSACLATVGVFAQQAPGEEQTLSRTETGARAVTPAGGLGASGDKPCYKKTNEYRSRYAKGIVFYLRGKVVVGLVFWNVDEELLPDRRAVVDEILRARPTVDDIEMLTDLVNFHKTKAEVLILCGGAEQTEEEEVEEIEETKPEPPCRRPPRVASPCGCPET